VKVFISHAAADAELARRVGSVLREAGFQVWDYADEILPGENWGQKLGEALQESDAMVVLLTPDSLRAQNVNYEIGYALGKADYRGRLIPVIAAPPEQLTPESIPWVLSRLRTVRLSDQEQEGGLRRIVEALREAA